MSDMNTKEFWEGKEDVLVNILINKKHGQYDAGWYGGQLDLVRKILNNMSFEE
jgi:hypothetical protein